MYVTVFCLMSDMVHITLKVKKETLWSKERVKVSLLVDEGRSLQVENGFDEGRI